MTICAVHEVDLKSMIQSLPQIVHKYIFKSQQLVLDTAYLHCNHKRDVSR